MIALIQRVRFVQLKIEGKIYSSIGPGMLILLGISTSDEEKQAQWLAKKTAGLRFFSDNEGKMNLDVMTAEGQIMVVSQFTLLADASHGNRPSYTRAAHPEKAIPLYQFFIDSLNQITGKEIKTGVFGADMQVEFCNDGPVTVWLDTENLMR